MFKIQQQQQQENRGNVLSLHYFRERLQVSPITYCASSDSPRLCLGSGL